MASQSHVLTLEPRNDREQRKAPVVYWIITTLVMLQLVFSAILLIVQPAPVIAVVRHLGYPVYFPFFLGIAKLLAVVALAQPWSATLKEWAYAGITCDVLAAELSHASSHDPLQAMVGPFLILGVVATSYFLYFREKRFRRRPQY